MLWPCFREPVSAWTHFLWLLLAIPATWILWRQAPRRLAERLGVLAFGAGLIVCSAASWLFHSVPAEVLLLFQTVDHIGIYLMIAGTVTPIGLVVLSGRWRALLVGGIWLLAAVGISLRLRLELTLGTMTLFYLGMGWIGCLMYFQLARELTHGRMRSLWIGGLFYTVGAVLNRLHWPVIVPGVVEAHEVFHLFVVLGSASHYHFLLTAVIPYRGTRQTKAVRVAPVELPRLDVEEGSRRNVATQRSSQGTVSWR